MVQELFNAYARKRESSTVYPASAEASWIPAFAGMTRRIVLTPRCCCAVIARSEATKQSTFGAALYERIASFRQRNDSSLSFPRKRESSMV